MWGAVFSGQGSQFVGMGKVFYENFASSKHLFEEASDSIGVDLKKLCFDGPEDALTLTENTQPCLLLVSTAMFRAFKETTSFKPTHGAGHSLGEYSALVATETLRFSDAIKAVRLRGQAMQSACPVGEGGMAAVLSWEDTEVEKLCQWTEKSSGLAPLRPANFNSPGQVVISGNQKAIEWLKANYDPETSGLGKRLKMIPLNVSAPFHSPLMKPAQEKMESVLNELSFSKPVFPIVQNTTAQENSDPNQIRTQLCLQISAPVKWSQSVQRLKALGVNQLIEFGPGKVLTGLVKKIDSEFFETFNMQTLEDFKALEQKLNL